MPKILLDCVVTSGDPGKCSSNIQFLTFVARTLETTDDVFFYWMIPDWITEEQFKETYPQDDRVLYIRIPQHKDRTIGYLTLSAEMDKCIAFNGEFWDYDILVTMRSGLVPLMRLLMTSPRLPMFAYMKEVWLIEEMPLMTFKKTVRTINGPVQDMYTLSGHLTADKSYILSYHEKQHMVNRAKDFFTPTHVRQLDAKIKPVVTVQFSDYRLKDPADYPPPPGKGRPFCIAHSGRMEKSNNIDGINSLMTKQFVMKGARVRLLVTTVSQVVKAFDTSVVEVVHANRAEFWRLAKEEMDIFVHMSPEGGVLLSLLEPMMLGVPAIVIREDWSEGLLGKNYPFMVDTEAQAYAMVGEFYNDYAKMYGRWADYHVNVFQPMMNHRFEHDLLYPLLEDDLIAFRGMPAKYGTNHPGKAENLLVAEVQKLVQDRDEFVFEQAVQELVELKKVEAVMAQKLEPGDRSRRHLAFASFWTEYRIALKAFYGWEDASTKVGHMKRIKK